MNHGYFFIPEEPTFPVDDTFLEQLYDALAKPLEEDDSLAYYACAYIIKQPDLEIGGS